MRMYDIIEKKRDGTELSHQEIDFFIQDYTKGKIPDYQVSALLMAIYFQGMSIRESADLTMAMVHSGDIVDLSDIKGIKVDKHSTGGVGDTTTLTLLPLVASAGVKVAKMSGRGLGHTGGTIDKLEAIPGFHVEISNDRFKRLVNETGLALIGQSSELAPADKLLYSLRDVTATVNSIPLIASSIMSKKIAAGSDKIVLDVKTGAGAFMKNLDDAKLLAETMVAIGKKVGKETVAIISNMEQPLGRAIGNSLEVKEAIETLQGKGPGDLTELTLELGSQMVVLAKQADSLEKARQMLIENMNNGKALAMFKQLIHNQDGDSSVVDDPSLIKQAPYQIDILAEESGFVTEMIADQLGKAAMMLGAGRETKESVIDLSVGIILHKKLGDAVKQGDVLCTIHSNEAQVASIEKLILQAIKLSEEKKNETLILNIIK